MFATWLEEYQKITRKTQFISQLAMFLISTFTILGFYDIVRVLYFNSLNIFEIHGLSSAIIFQFSILIIFATRFVLTFFDKEKYFWLNQILWLFGFSLLIIYWYISRPVPGPFEMYSTFGPEIFGHASRYFDSFGMWYLILSPTRRFVMFIYSLIKVGRNKI
ncbi:hypothetical protein BH20ACI1_BH20ACI1_04400 [soil metagenome]